MIDLTTDAGFRQIKWVSAPNLGVSAPRWNCHRILHGGDGPLTGPMIVNTPVGQKSLTAWEAAEMAAAKVYEITGGLQSGEREVIRIAVHLQGLEFCAFGVVVTLEPTFDAREL